MERRECKVFNGTETFKFSSNNGFLKNPLPLVRLFCYQYQLGLYMHIRYDPKEPKYSCWVLGSEMSQVCSWHAQYLENAQWKLKSKEGRK